MSQRYRLVFRGQLIPGFSPEQIAANLATLFKVSPERIGALLATTPTIIKQTVDIDAGNRYIEALANAGIITHLEALDDAEKEPDNSKSWSGPERRQGERRSSISRRAGRRDNAIQPDRRLGRDRRGIKTP